MIRPLRVALWLDILAEKLQVAGTADGGHEIRKVLGNRRMRRMLITRLRDEYQVYQDEGGEQTFWQWLWEHREEILEFILQIISIFAAL